MFVFNGGLLQLLIFLLFTLTITMQTYTDPKEVRWS